MANAALQNMKFPHRKKPFFRTRDSLSLLLNRVLRDHAGSSSAHLCSISLASGLDMKEWAALGQQRVRYLCWEGNSDSQNHCCKGS